MSASTKKTSEQSAKALEGHIMGPGVCDWCKQEVDERVLSWDRRIIFCENAKDCNRRRNRHLILTGQRPTSWYINLTEREVESTTECKRAGLVPTDIMALGFDKRDGLVYDTEVGLPPTDGNDD